jgi:UDP-N-acetylmuramate: L-alanyl-gamma-D-glutamyl-meso-diaminopimelate ligase
MPYVNALHDAAVVFIKVPEPHDKVPVGEQLDVNEIVNDLKAEDVAAYGSSDVEELVRLVAAEARPGDVVLVMSNGAFGGFIGKLLTALGGSSS